MVKFPEIKFVRIIRFFILLLIPFLLLFFSTFITMKIILGGNEVVVPRIEGKDVKSARIELGKLGIKLKIIGEKFSDLYEKGTIIKQYPYPDFKIKKEKSVKVIVSEGARKIMIPKLIGFTFFEAKNILEENGLYLRHVSFAHCLDSERNLVVDQYPPPMTKNVEVPFVDILVNMPKSEKEYIMPDLVGLPYKDVVYFLKKNGFLLKPLDFELDFSHPSGIVVAQYPEKGVKIEWKNPISLVISR